MTVSVAMSGGSRSNGAVSLSTAVIGLLITELPRVQIRVIGRAGDNSTLKQY